MTISYRLLAPLCGGVLLGGASAPQLAEDVAADSCCGSLRECGGDLASCRQALQACGQGPQGPQGPSIHPGPMIDMDEVERLLEAGDEIGGRFSGASSAEHKRWAEAARKLRKTTKVAGRKRARLEKQLKKDEAARRRSAAALDEAREAFDDYRASTESGSR